MQQSVLFGEFVGKPVVARFDQPDSTSDAGALLLQGVDERLGLSGALADCLTDSRDASKVRHSLGDVVRQRVYAIACGYEDGNDAARLRDDPVQKLLLDRDPVRGDALASQPTLSRFENTVGKRDLIAMGYALMDGVIARHRKRLGRRVKRITIDLDGTEDATHGEQQLSFFNGFYGGFCLLPMAGFLQFDQEQEQYLFASVLRPGNANGRTGALGILRRMLPRLRKAFPKAVLRVRLDGGFAAPEVFEFLERENVEYVVAVAKNPVLDRLAEPLLNETREASDASGESERRYGDANYRAGSWNRERRVVFKAEVTRYPGRAARDNPRYLVTNLTHDPHVVYQQVYAKRGDAENRLKELKGGLAFDRTSCTRFLANQVRLLLTAVAYVMYQELRLLAAGTGLAKAQVTTLRERLFKLGGWVTRSTRRIVIHLPRQAPWRQEWCRIARALHPQPA